MLPVRVIQRNRCRIHQRLIIQRQSLCPCLACSGITDVILATVFHRNISPVEGSTGKWRKNFVRCLSALCSIISFSQKILSFVPSLYHKMILSPVSSVGCNVSIAIKSSRYITRSKVWRHLSSGKVLFLSRNTNVLDIILLLLFKKCFIQKFPVIAKRISITLKQLIFREFSYFTMSSRDLVD